MGMFPTPPAQTNTKVCLTSCASGHLLLKGFSSVQRLQNLSFHFILFNHSSFPKITPLNSTSLPKAAVKSLCVCRHSLPELTQKKIPISLKSMHFTLHIDLFYYFSFKLKEKNLSKCQKILCFWSAKELSRIQGRLTAIISFPCRRSRDISQHFLVLER